MGTTLRTNRGINIVEFILNRCVYVLSTTEEEKEKDEPTAPLEDDASGSAGKWALTASPPTVTLQV